jgi:S1-C subfamily serine protease
MSMYELPNFDFKNTKYPDFLKGRIFWLSVLIIIISFSFGFLGGIASSNLFSLKIKDSFQKIGLSDKEYSPQTTQEQAIINAVKSVSPAVVSIVITKDVPVMEQYYEDFFGFQMPQYRQNGTEKQEVGGGTGFIVSDDGTIVTNKHVVLDEEAEYTVLTNDGEKYSAKVLARDPIQDLAIIKIEPDKTIDSGGNVSFKSFPSAKLGDSDNLQIGQTVVAIGNALGEFRNTVSVGVVSGLSRTITASGAGIQETIEDVIQTDAAINSGNSGGPLLNLKGEVIGINTATVQGAQSIGFAITVNKAKRDINQVGKLGKIVYPFLGVRYVLVIEEVQKEYGLDVDYGALILKGENNEEAITKGSAADKAGLKEKDIILEFNGEKITIDNSLSKLIQKYNPGDSVTLKILREKEEMTISVVLGEREE